MQAGLDGTDDAPTRLRITQALAEIPDAAAREALARLTRDDDKTVASGLLSRLSSAGAVARGERDRLGFRHTLPGLAYGSEAKGGKAAKPAEPASKPAETPDAVD